MVADDLVERVRVSDQPAGEPFVALEVSPTAENLARLAFEHARGQRFPVSAVELVEQPGSIARYAP